MPKKNHIEGSQKIAGSYSPKLPCLVQDSVVVRKCPTPGFFAGRERKEWKAQATF